MDGQLDDGCCGTAGCAATWQLDAATRVPQHMLQVLVSHFGLNNSRGVKLLWLCRLPVASGQWLLPVAIAGAGTHCCC